MHINTTTISGINLLTANKNLFTISFIFYTTQNKISPNIDNLLNGVLRPKLLNSLLLLDF